MTHTVDRVGRLLSMCGTDSGLLPPTTLYSEGWMLRLVLDWFARQEPSDHPLAFTEGARWYSEALLGSQFRARHRGDPLAEAWTHADGIVGHFRVRLGRGDVELERDARQLVVIEAKLYSGLAAGTTRAATFNQAARNAACLAQLVSDRAPEQFERLGFVVLAPSEQIERGVFGSLCDKGHVRACVAERVAGYAGEKDRWYHERFLPALDVLDSRLISWEQVLDDISAQDAETGEGLHAFYAQCVRFNRPPSVRPESSGRVSNSPEPAAS